MEVSVLSFLVTEQLISKATVFPTNGEQFFKSHVLAGVNVSFFLRRNLRIAIGEPGFKGTGYKTNDIACFTSLNNISPTKEDLIR